MNWAHVHLLINHFPVVGSVLGTVLFAVALVRRSDEMTRTALGGFFILAIVAILVYLTGEPAEDVVKDLPGVSQSMIEQHEEVALLAAIALGGFGAICLAALAIFRRRPLPHWVPVTGLVLSMVPTTLFAVTAYFGGQIHHSEIRPGSAADSVEALPQLPDPIEP